MYWILTCSWCFLVNFWVNLSYVVNMVFNLEFRVANDPKTLGFSCLAPLNIIRLKLRLSQKNCSYGSLNKEKIVHELFANNPQT